jgi:hypothetical protein
LASLSVPSPTSRSACAPYGGFFDYDLKKERLEEVSRELEDPAIWQKPEKAQELGKERAKLETETSQMDSATRAVIDSVDTACQDPNRGGIRNRPKTHAIVYASADQYQRHHRLRRNRRIRTDFPRHEQRSNHHRSWVDLHSNGCQ